MQEVDECKDECKTAMTDAQEMKRLIEKFRRKCEKSGKGEGELSESLCEAFEELEQYVLYHRLQQEVDQKLAENGGDATHKMLASIPLLDAVIQEVSDRVLSLERSSSVSKTPYRRFVSGRPTTCLAPSHPVGRLSQAS